MENYLIDVPVMVFLWIRPEFQRRQFEIIKQAKPSTLFVISDGGRTEEEWKNIRINREMYDTEIDWDCKVYKFYSDVNLGTYGIMIKQHELIWSHVDRCIILEDDILPSLSFFPFCAELLEKYKDDERIYMICGMNHEGISEGVSSDYFFSRYGSIWGIATWKRFYQEYYDFRYKDDPYTLKALERLAEHNMPGHEKQIASVAKHGRYDGHIPGDEYYMSLAVYSQNQLLIIPRKNMITNIGCDPNAEHSTNIENLPKGIRRVFNMIRWETSFPLKHPDFVFPDLRYEQVRNRIMAFGHPVIMAYRNAEAVYRNIKNGNGDYVRSRLSKLIGLKQGTFHEK